MCAAKGQTVKPLDHATQPVFIGERLAEAGYIGDNRYAAKASGQCTVDIWFGSEAQQDSWTVTTQ